MSMRKNKQQFEKIYSRLGEISWLTVRTSSIINHFYKHFSFVSLERKYNTHFTFSYSKTILPNTRESFQIYSNCLASEFAYCQLSQVNDRITWHVPLVKEFFSLLRESYLPNHVLILNLSSNCMCSSTGWLFIQCTDLSLLFWRNAWQTNTIKTNNLFFEGFTHTLACKFLNFFFECCAHTKSVSQKNIFSIRKAAQEKIACPRKSGGEVGAMDIQCPYIASVPYFAFVFQDQNLN
jgi:hypothetical protein